MSTVYLIGCSAAKRASSCPAGELYVGALFQAARFLATWRGAEWAILSAKHGLLVPDQVVEPYDQRMATGGPARDEWARQVAWQLMRYQIGTHFVILASEPYRAVFELYHEALDQWYTWEAPLAGMGIGRQKQWLAQQAAPVRA